MPLTYSRSWQHQEPASQLFPRHGVPGKHGDPGGWGCRWLPGPRLGGGPEGMLGLVGGMMGPRRCGWLLHGGRERLVTVTSDQ